ncbi:MAG: hypothetical protein KUG65_05955 [Sphingomonadaceae bacterium]|nr:hypothetical protein [Sphingomonadaceae bacterium]
MTHKALAGINQIIAALTDDEIEQNQADGTVLRDEQVPLLNRSISHDLLQVESVIGARGKTLLSAIAAAIDEALLAAEQARQVLDQASASNVNPAPFFLNEKTVSDILDDKGGSLPVEPALLIDQPRHSEDPSLAKANDDRPDETVDDPLHEPAPETFPSPVWPDAPLPDELGTPDELSQFEASKAHLKSMGILVSIIDPDAEILKYRVLGHVSHMLPGKVVELAMDMGMKA